MTYKLAKTSQDADQYFGAVSLLLDGTDLQDKSLDTKTLTVNGDAQVSTAQSKWNGSSLAFDGTGDYLIVPNSSDFDFGSGDFTIECWAYFNSATAIFNFINKRTSTAGIAPFILGTSTSGKFAFYASSNGTSWNVIAGTQFGSFSASQWVHVAVVRNGSSFTGYVNGTGTSLGTNSSALVTNTSSVHVGGDTNNRYLNGYLQDVRITKGVARYTATFTPPTQPFFGAINPDQDRYFYATSLLLHGDGTNGSTNIVDSSGDPKTITVNGDAQISTAQSKFGGSSLYFDGTGDYLIADTDLTISNSNFTFEAWVNMDWTSQNCQITGSSSNDFNLFIDSASGNLKFYNGGTVYTFSNSSIPADTWTHVAMVREGTGTNETKVYVNGVNTDTITLSKTWTTTIDIYIGRNGSAGTVYANGYIDDLRMTTGVARYTSDFTPPTKAFPDY